MSPAFVPGVPVDEVFAGSGTLFPCLLGAHYELARRGMKTARVAGTSGGALAAAAVAHGLPAERALGFMGQMLVGGDLLDGSPLNAIYGYGWHKGEKIRALLRKVFPGKMGDAKTPWSAFAFNVEVSRTVRFDSMACPEVSTVDVLMASMAIPVFFTHQRVTGVPGLYVDGGVQLNFAMACFDDAPDRRTIGIRFRRRPREPIEWRKNVVIQINPVRSAVESMRRIGQALISNASSTYVSRKRYANVVEIDTDGGAMDFSVSKSDVKARWEEGVTAARIWATANN